ncbi:UvrABC system protein C [Methanobacterium lacus]|uniref:UvrABC system protein C n=1 Tax=Methanobacterium lacus (strain AL-21) TaxID=877455 RepID=F0T5Z4_METLA|nr:excinuclease ABC subunit UvrC [Methanobacterium lacus]ADZ09387.1 UvrABC system protein C [Methanobacterium lacus]
MVIKSNDPDDLPLVPGVYLLKDSADRILYVGKAKSLKKRVKSYFRSDLDPKTRALMNQFHHLEYIVTDTEKEALILESNLIKKHMPRYNIRLKDDKRYPYIRVTNEKFPRVIITRRVLDDGSYYYGPFTEATTLRRLVKFIKALFKVRDCKNMDGPCLNYQIDLCRAPCDNKISEAEYKRMVDNVSMFFEGKYDQIMDALKEEMMDAAENHEFEKAAVLRDQINSVEDVLEKQKMEFTGDLDQDVIASASDEELACVAVFSVRNGKIIGREDFLMGGGENSSEEKIVTAFLKQYYMGPRHVPSKIILHKDIEDRKLIEEWLSEKREANVGIEVPVEGIEFRLAKMVSKNAQILLNHQKEVKGALVDLKKYLGIAKIPKRIEAYDISNISGQNAVGSMVVFEDGTPKKSAYRRYKIETEGPDDYAMMKEMLTRRFTNLINNQDSEPDLVLVDGGKGQLNIALEVFYSLNINYPVIGLAKEFEHVFIPQTPSPLILPRNSEALLLLQRIRDEAHRFAITYHKQLRSKEFKSSPLDKIPGVGNKRRMLLLKHFGSMENIMNADLDELQQVKGISKKLANIIHDHFDSLNIKKE